MYANVVRMKNNQELTSLVCHAIIANKLPEAALQWDIIEVVNTTIARGCGESTSWDCYTLIRQNGKQIWKDTRDMFNYEEPLQKLFGDNLIEVTKTRKGNLYVLKPQETK
jgi:hypothetical protein